MWVFQFLPSLKQKHFMCTRWVSISYHCPGRIPDSRAANFATGYSTLGTVPIVVNDEIYTSILCVAIRTRVIIMQLTDTTAIATAMVKMISPTVHPPKKMAI